MVVAPAVTTRGFFRYGLAMSHPTSRRPDRPLPRNLMAVLLVLSACGDPPPAVSVASAPKDAASAETASLPAADGGAGTDTAAPSACLTDSDCAATPIACRVSFCDNHTVCNTKPATGTMTCDDGNACTTTDACANGLCGGVVINCDDGNLCTADFCLPAKGCIHDNLVKPCATDDLCAPHACSSGKCSPISTAPCDDGNACTADSCKAQTGCTYKALTAQPCTDGDDCTKNDMCKFGKCKGIGKSCGDGNVCTDDGCDAAGTCSHGANTVGCSDGNPCTSADKCGGGTCSGVPVVCQDSSACTKDFCNAINGFCDVSPASDVTVCDDNDPCSIGETCAGLACKGGVAKVCNDDNPCTADSCDPPTGECQFAPIDEGLACGKDNLCLTAGACSAGKCSGTLKVCDDQNPCTQDLCDPASGLCTKGDVADGTPCGVGKTCTAGVCL